MVAAENAEALEAWNGVLFDRFAACRHLNTLSGQLLSAGFTGIEFAAISTRRSRPLTASSAGSSTWIVGAE